MNKSTRSTISFKFFIVAAFLFFAFANGWLIVNALAQTTQLTDCTRATPTRIVKKSVFPKTTFKLSRDRRTGTETVKFSNGDRLIITNAGCEYYYLGFRFETRRFSARTANTKYWFAQAVKLIAELEKGINAQSIQIPTAVRALKKYIKKTPQPKVGEEIDYGGTDIRTFVAVKKIKRLPKGKFALELYFAVGPL